MKDPKNFKFLSGNVREDSSRDNRSELSRFSRNVSNSMDTIWAVGITFAAVVSLTKIFGKKDDRRDRNNRRNWVEITYRRKILWNTDGKEAIVG